MKAIAVAVVALGVCLAGAGAEAFSVSYDQKVTQAGHVITGTVSMKDQMFRMEATMDGQAAVTLRNASGTYTYLPQEGMAMRLPALNPTQRPIEHADNYQQYLKERQAERIGAETVDGHPCDIYRFTEPAMQETVTAWVWTEKHFPIKMEIEGAHGKTLVEIQNVRVGAAIPEAAFELPAGVQVMDMGGMMPAGQQQ